jgi:hypothetical protein
MLGKDHQGEIGLAVFGGRHGLLSSHARIFHKTI